MSLRFREEIQKVPRRLRITMLILFLFSLTLLIIGLTQSNQSLKRAGIAGMILAVVGYVVMMTMFGLIEM